MAERLRNFVDGAAVDAKDGRTTAVVDPSTGETYAEAPLSGQADVDLACEAAAAAFDSWRDTTPSERSLMLLKLADAIESRAEDFVTAEGRNTGKPLALTRSEEVPPMVDQIRFFAGAARVLEGRSAGEYLAGHTSWIRREPIGVVGQVTPWNYPMMMAIWKIAPALAAGNTVVLKPSDTTPVTTVMLAELAGGIFPPGVFNVVCGDRDTGRALVSHPAPQLVSITGSVRAGREVALTAAEDLKRVHLELGGKAPVIVFDDADVEKAAEAIAIAGYFNAGQDCTAATRVLASASAYANMVDALADQARQTTFGSARSTTPPSSSGSRGWFPASLPTPASSWGARPREALAFSTRPPSSPVWSRPTSWPRARSSGRSSRCNASATRIRPWRGPTAWSTAWRRASGPRITAGPCGYRGASTSGASGSTPTSRW
jgi:betaine-aldehyde dehydrogenase